MRMEWISSVERFLTFKGYYKSIPLHNFSVFSEHITDTSGSAYSSQLSETASGVKVSMMCVGITTVHFGTITEHINLTLFGLEFTIF